MFGGNKVILIYVPTFDKMTFTCYSKVSLKTEYPEDSEKKYKILRRYLVSLYTIEKGKTKATISSLGATVTNFQVGGQEILFPQYWLNTDKARGGCPICAPWFGQGKKEGDHYKHGYLRYREATKVTYTKSQAHFIFARQGRAEYPWLVGYDMILYVAENVFMMTLIVSRGKDGLASPAPILPGFHPYFSCANAAEVKVKMLGEIQGGFSEKSRTIPIRDSKIDILMPGRTIEMFLLKGFQDSRSQLVLWSDNPGYACIEPIMAERESFRAASGFYLNQGQSLEMQIGLAVY